MEGNIVPTEVVDEEKDDVGCRRSGKGGGQGDKGDAKVEEHGFSFLANHRCLDVT